MALVETNPKSTECETNLRMACADELSAQSLYRELRTQVQNSSLDITKKDDIIRRLTEIIKDEEEHLGSLLYCIALLDPEAMTNIDKGAKGA